MKMFPGVGGVPSMGQNGFLGPSPEMYNAAMGGMMGNPAAFNQGRLQGQRDMLESKHSGNKRQVEETLKNMAQSSKDAPPQGHFGNQSMRSMSPSTLNLIRAGSLVNSHGNQSRYDAATREQLCIEAAMYSG
ncbi:hypothetical protein ACHAWF_011473, partial [Thalassiosira exigua]